MHTSFVCKSTKIRVLVNGIFKKAAKHVLEISMHYVCINQTRLFALLEGNLDFFFKVASQKEKQHAHENFICLLPYSF